MKRFIQRLEDFKKALDSLSVALKIDFPDEVQKDGTIQRFEYTFECAWKALDQFMVDGGGQEYVKNVKTIFKEANNRRIIKSITPYLKMTDARNKTSHEYDEGDSREIYIKIKEDYFVLLQDLYETLLINSK